jgi:hypothetical protein
VLVLLAISAVAVCGYQLFGNGGVKNQPTPNVSGTPSATSSPLYFTQKDADRLEGDVSKSGVGEYVQAVQTGVGQAATLADGVNVTVQADTFKGTEELATVSATLNESRKGSFVLYLTKKDGHWRIIKTKEVG